MVVSSNGQRKKKLSSIDEWFVCWCVFESVHLSLLFRWVKFSLSLNYIVHKCIVEMTPYVHLTVDYIGCEGGGYGVEPEVNENRNTYTLCISSIVVEVFASVAKFEICPNNIDSKSNPIDPTVLVLVLSQV